MNTSVSLNIALLPDKKITQAAINLSQELNDSLTTNFILNTENLIPHLTIYQAQFPTKNIPEIERQVQEALQDMQTFDLELFNFSATPQGNVWWNAVDPEPMASLQKEIIKRCNALREESLLPGLENMINIGPEYANEINNYGSLWLNDRYSPHISLTAVSPEDIEKTLEFLGDEKKDNFVAREIFIGYLGKYGTVTEIIKKFTLS